MALPDRNLTGPGTGLGLKSHQPKPIRGSICPPKPSQIVRAVKATPTTDHSVTTKRPSDSCRSLMSDRIGGKRCSVCAINVMGSSQSVTATSKHPLNEGACDWNHISAEYLPRYNPVVSYRRRRQTTPMGTGSVTTPDLFSKPTNREEASSENSSPNIAEKDSSRYVLPKDLPNAIKQLSDKELDELSVAVSVEQQRRGKRPSSNENAKKLRVQEVSVPLTVGKTNAVRAAFKAGLKPSQIARQFKVSRADIRKALTYTKSGSGSRE